MRDKSCPLMVSAAISAKLMTQCTHEIAKCVKEKCSYYDEHAQQCSQVSQAMALRDIAEQLKRNADAMMDYSPAKEPVEVELQKIAVGFVFKKCESCKHSALPAYEKPCSKCVGSYGNWEPK